MKITGELPRELNGTLYRNGPNPQFDSPGAHWFVGDGMLHAFHLENGRASYRNRWVRTPKWQAEHDAGRALFGGFGRKLPDAPPSTTTDGGVANTNIIFHAGTAAGAGRRPSADRDRARHAEASAAIATTMAPSPGPSPRIPRSIPVTGEMVFFGYNAAGPLTPALSFGSVNASGVVTRFERFEAPYASMVHDFIVTENHLLFPILPITGSMERAMRGQPPYAWEPEKGAYVGVMKRNGSAKDIDLVPRRKLLRLPRHERVGGRRPHHRRRHAVRGSAAVHPSRRLADRSGKIARPLLPLDLRSRRQTPTASRRPISTTSPANSRASTTAAPASPRRHGWYACANPELPMFGALSGIVHVDGKGKRLGNYLLPAGDTISEPVFVERGKDAAEGDGWLLAVVWRARENRSDLAVFNATDVEAGPVALVHLGHRVPDGFHGNWVGRLRSLHPSFRASRSMNPESRGDGSRFRVMHRECALSALHGESAMHMPSITALSRHPCLALRRARAAGHAAAAEQSGPFGDGDNTRLRSAIRVHANFIEYVPIIALLVALLEMSGTSALRVHLLMGALLVSRLLHPLGMYAGPGTLPF